MSAIESNQLQYHHPYSFSECGDTLEHISVLPNFFGKVISELAQKCLKNSNETKLLDDLIHQLKNRIDSFKEAKDEAQKSALKEMKSAINQLINMQKEKAFISNKVEEEFLTGNYEASIKILEGSVLRYSQNHLHKAYYFGELARFHMVMGKCDKGQKFVEKEESYVNKIHEKNTERKFSYASLYFNKSQLYQKKVWCAENSPYTSRTLKDDAQSKEIVEILNQWKSLFANYSTLEEKREFCRACSNLGNIYAAQCQYDEAIKVYKEGLKASKEDILDIFMELSIDIGDLYQHIPYGYRKAIKHYEKAEFFARILEVPHAVATCLTNKGFCRYRLLLEDRELKKHFNIAALADKLNAKHGYSTSNVAESERRTIEEEKQAKILIEKEFREAIRIFSELEWNLKDIENQVFYFNVHDLAYTAFENFLYAENRTEEALEIAQSRRARALMAFIEKKYSLAPSQDKVLTVEEIKNLANQFNTTFILYSLAPCQLKAPGPNIRIWVISSKGVATAQTPIPKLLDEIAAFSDTMKAITGELRTNVKKVLEIIQKEINSTEETVDDLIDNPEIMIKFWEHSSFCDLERCLTELKKAIDQVNKQLEDWYTILIPNELDNIIKESRNSLTIIPERELAHIPFAALRYKDNNNRDPRYLVEDYSLSIAPSIHTLKVLNELEKSDSSQKEEGALVVYSNPKEDLPNAPKELERVCSSFENLGFPVTSLTKDKASYESFFKEIQKPRHGYIHLICHGTDKQAACQDSVFKGALKFTSTINGYKYIFGNDIAQQKLEARLVFISSCLSGKGKIHQEGNVGLAWAFLAAGAKSIVSCHWPLYDTVLTLDMVQDFYDLVFKEKTDKAEALQKVICKALKNNRNRPDKWGLLFLSGSTNPVEVPKKKLR